MTVGEYPGYHCLGGANTNARRVYLRASTKYWGIGGKHIARELFAYAWIQVSYFGQWCAPDVVTIT